LVFFFLDTFGFAVEVAVELDLAFAGAAGAVDWASTAAAVNIAVRIKRFIFGLFLLWRGFLSPYVSHHAPRLRILR
jgi:hypothetical protein